MTNITRKLNKGLNVIVVPNDVTMSLTQLFPKELAGAKLSMLSSTGEWLSETNVQYKNDDFIVADEYRMLPPFVTLKLILKRPLIINWQSEFQSNSSLTSPQIGFETGFSCDEALYMAQLCQLVYEPEATIKQIIAEKYQFDDFFYYSKSSHKALLKTGIANLLLTFFNSRRTIVDLQFMYMGRYDELSKKKLITIVFQGSQEPEDWLTNFSLKDQKFLKAGKVHKGFYNSLKLFFRTIKRFHRKSTDPLLALLSEEVDVINDNYRIMLSGHSLGGAIATLTGCYLRELGIKKEHIEIYTFGAPPVATKDFCDFYDPQLDVYRVTNQNDIVPKLDKVTNLFHLGTHINLISNHGEIHACDEYIENIIEHSQSN